MIGVNSLETLCYTYIHSENLNGNIQFICPIINAKNGNCYTALYKYNNNSAEVVVEPIAVPLDVAIPTIKSYVDNSVIFVGDGVSVFKDDISSSMPYSTFSDIELINSYSLGFAGLLKYKSGNIESALPLYLKKPQAERELENKLKNGG